MKALKVLKVVAVVTVLVAAIFFAIASVAKKEEQASSTSYLGEGVWHIYPREVVAGTFSLNDSFLSLEARREACQAIEFRLHAWITIQANRGAVVHRETPLYEVEFELIKLGWKTYRTGVYSIPDITFNTVGY